MVQSCARAAGRRISRETCNNLPAALEELHRPLVFLGGGPRLKSAEILAALRAWINLARI